MFVDRILQKAARTTSALISLLFHSNGAQLQAHIFVCIPRSKQSANNVTLDELRLLHVQLERLY